MKLKAVLLPSLYLLTAASFTAGYLLEGFWIIVPVLLGIGPLFFIAQRRSEYQAASVLLVGSFTLAAAGVLMELSFILMLVGCVGALASWDLMLFSQSVMRASNREGLSLLEQSHYQSLTIAIVGGTIASFTAANLVLDLPFILTLLLCAIALGGVYFGVRVLIKDQK